MKTIYYKFTGNIDRRNPRNEEVKGVVDYNSPYMRENLLSRDRKLQKVKGTKTFTTALSDIPTWTGRYYTVESGNISPKTFSYTKDGKFWFIDESGTPTSLLTTLNLNAYPRHQIFKTQSQSKMYVVDGKDLYRYDGNNDNKFEKVIIVDTDGNSIYPIDVMEHRDRLILISDTYVYISKNLGPDIYDDSTDCIQLIVGSGKGKNMALGKLGDTQYILNTEGIFAIAGDVISAVASTFELRLIPGGKKCIAGGSVKRVENALLFLADDFNVWSFNGTTCTKLTHNEKLEDFVNQDPTALKKAVATYEDSYYKLSFVENADTVNRLELWWCAIESKCEFIRGRNVSCYLEIDSTEEEKYYQFGHSYKNYLMWANTEWNFEDEAIRVRLWTKDITPRKGQNLRFKAFYPEILAIGDTHTIFGYNLDGRIDGLNALARWTQSFKGETTAFGVISLIRGTQRTYRVRPRIKYAKGQSVAFYVDDSTLGSDWKMLGIGIDFVGKESKHKEPVGA